MINAIKALTDEKVRAVALIQSGILMIGEKLLSSRGKLREFSSPLEESFRISTGIGAHLNFNPQIHGLRWGIRDDCILCEEGFISGVRLVPCLLVTQILGEIGIRLPDLISTRNGITLRKLSPSRGTY